MNNLKKYIKDNPDKLDAVTTSVNLERRHMDFIQRLNLNLSAMIRDFIDQLINDQKNKGGKNESK